MARDPLLIRCEEVSHCSDKGQDCIVIVFEVVRCVRLKSNDGNERIEYEGAHFTELPKDYFPRKPLALTEHPAGVGPVLVAREYRGCAPLHGAVTLFVVLRDSDFDAATLVGRVFLAEETTGPGGAQPLFSDLT